MQQPWKMISRYGKKPANENANQDENHERPATESRRVVMVYSDFNMQFMAHATSGTSAAGVVASRAERQHSDDDDEVVVRSRAV